MAMQWLGALAPLVVFWALEEFWGLKAALIGGCIAAVLEISWEWVRSKRVSRLTWVANGLVLGMGAVSFWMDNGVAFKLQPMVLELGMAGMLLVLRWRGEPFFLQMIREGKAPGVGPEKRELILNNPVLMARLANQDLKLITFLLFHGLLIGWAAVWGSTRVWILLKGVLFYVLLVVAMVPYRDLVYRIRHARISK